MIDFRVLQQMVLTAVEASYYVEPRSPGLSFEELVEVGRGVGREQGEIMMGLRYAGQDVQNRNARYTLAQDRLDVGGLADFVMGYDPWPRNVEAFQFVHDSCQRMLRQSARVEIEREVMVAQAAAAGIPSKDTEVAITLLILAGRLVDQEGILRQQVAGWASPKEQRDSTDRHLPRDDLRKMLPLVQDVISRRSDGRPSAADPVDAFAEALTLLGHDRFSLWWQQMKAELLRASPRNSPTTVLVLAAAMAEAALALSVRRALESGTTMQRNLPDDPRQWKFHKLLESARSGSAPILPDAREADRCLKLNETRQRIHVGNLLVAMPAGNIPDTKPEEATEALAVLRLTLRRVLEWIERSGAKAE